MTLPTGAVRLQQKCDNKSRRGRTVPVSVQSRVSCCSGVGLLIGRRRFYPSLSLHTSARWLVRRVSSPRLSRLDSFASPRLSGVAERGQLAAPVPILGDRLDPSAGWSSEAMFEVNSIGSPSDVGMFRQKLPVPAGCVCLVRKHYDYDDEIPMEQYRCKLKHPIETLRIVRVCPGR